jgi:hypothetical protein
MTKAESQATLPRVLKEEYLRKQSSFDPRLRSSKDTPNTRVHLHPWSSTMIHRGRNPIHHPIQRHRNQAGGNYHHLPQLQSSRQQISTTQPSKSLVLPNMKHKSHIPAKQSNSSRTSGSPTRNTCMHAHPNRPACAQHLMHSVTTRRLGYLIKLRPQRPHRVNSNHQRTTPAKQLPSTKSLNALTPHPATSALSSLAAHIQRPIAYRALNLRFSRRRTSRRRCSYRAVFLVPRRRGVVVVRCWMGVLG